MRSVDRPGYADAGANDVATHNARLDKHLLPHASRPVEGVEGMVSDLQVAHALGQHVMREVGHGDLDMAVSNVDADHGSGRVLQHELNAGPTPTPIGHLGVDLEYQARIPQ